MWLMWELLATDLILINQIIIIIIMLILKFLADGHLPRVLRHSRLSTINKGDNEVKPGAVQRSLPFTLRLKNPENVS